MITTPGSPAMLPSGARRYPWLLAALLGQLVISPFLTGPVSDTLQDILFLAVLLASLGTVRASRLYRPIFVLALLCALGSVGKYLMEYQAATLVSEILGAVVLVLAVTEVVRYLALQRRVTPDMIMGGLCVYLFLGALWYLLFSMVANLDPGAFSFTVHGQHPAPREVSRLLFFFSYVSLLTTGYGDIVPLSPVAQALAMVEGIAGQFYIVFFMARLVGRDIAMDDDRPGDGAS